VLVQATVADNLLSGRFLKEAGAPRALSFLALLLLGPLVAFLVAAVERHLVGSLVAIALVAGWPVLCFAAFALRGWHLEMLAPAAAGLLALVVSLRYQVGSVDARARFIRRTFERYVSQAVVEEMLRHPERVRLGGERRELTVLFSDIRGFTSISERLAPEEVAALINGFFTPMTRVVLEQGGTLDKYMGDALMAFFGAPVAQEDHAVRACRAALAMGGELRRLNAEWRRDGRLPEDVSVGLGIGLNSGPMSVGNMGSEQVFDYTVLGDNVNLGSRVEGLNKLYGTEILVTGGTVEAVRRAEAHPGVGSVPGFLFRELDRVRVKGKTEPVDLYELLAERPAPAAFEERARRFEEALALYRARRFAEAAAAFEALDVWTRRVTPSARPANGDPPSRLLAERCRRLAADPPPPGWEPVETLTSK
jgi:adenylate cyclase